MRPVQHVLPPVVGNGQHRRILIVSLVKIIVITIAVILSILLLGRFFF